MSEVRTQETVQKQTQQQQTHQELKTTQLQQEQNTTVTDHVQQQGSKSKIDKLEGQEEVQYKMKQQTQQTVNNVSKKLVEDRQKITQKQEGSQEKIKQVAAEPVQSKNKKEKQQKKEQSVSMTSKEFKKLMKKLQKYDVAKAEYNTLAENYANVNRQRESLKKQLEEHQASFIQLQSSNRQLSQANQQLSKNNNLMTDSNQQLSDKNEQLKQEISRLEKEREQNIKETLLLKKQSEDQGKSLKLKGDLEQKVRQLQLIIDMTATKAEASRKNEERLKGQIDKYKAQMQKFRGQMQKFRELYRCQKQVSGQLKVQLQKLREAEKETFIMKQQLVRLTTEYKVLREEKEQLPQVLDKFHHQEHIINQLKHKIKQNQAEAQERKALIQKLQRRTAQLLQDKKELEKKYTKSRCDLEESMGQLQALKSELQEEQGEWQVQQKRYANDIKTLKTQLHKEHQKLKITQWELQESRKKQKPTVQMQRVNLMSLSQEDLLNCLEQMEMKNQSLKLNINQIADNLHQQQQRIKEQGQSIMALARHITRDYPTLDQSEGMEYLEKEIIMIGKQKQQDWPQIVEKVMIENLRLKSSVTALGQEFNQQRRREQHPENAS